MSKTFLHSGARGDIIYGLPTIKALGGGVLYISLDAKHYKSKPMDLQDLRWFGELLTGHDYIEDVRPYDVDTHIDYDLDRFRLLSPLSNVLISRAQLDAFNQNFDLSQSWLDCTKIGTLHKADIIINRSTRYHGPFSWGEVYPWQDRCLFIGMPDEYTQFTQITGLDGVPYYGVCAYRELAQVIAGSKLFIGNQSFAYSLAEAMKCPRVLEVCSICPNCMPQNDNGYTRLTQGLLKHYLLGEPYKLEFSMSYCMPTIGVSMRSGIRKFTPDITYILINAEPEVLNTFNERARRDKASVIPVGNSKEIPIAIAVSIHSRIICVVDTALLKDYTTARRVAELLNKHDGIAGMYVKQSLSPSNSCYAVSRKAYEECGLTKDNVSEIVQRYARSRYPFRSAGITDL